MARDARPTWQERVADRLRHLPTVYAVGTVLAVLAWSVAGDTWWVQPVALATFWWSLPALVLVAIALLAHRRRAVVLLSVPALLWVWSYGSLFVPNGMVSTAPDLRVATYNTYVAATGIDHVVALADATRPDVLLLQEVFPPRQDDILATLGERYPHHAAIQSPRIGGVMVLSRHPIVAQHPVSLFEQGVRDTAVVVLDVDGRRVQVVPVHLTSPCLSCGDSVTERLELEGQRRPAELAAVLDALERGVPAIVGGDLNSTERSAPYRMLTSIGFDDPQRAAGRGPGFTWPNDRLPFPVLRVDWILTRGLVAVDAWVGDGGPSDHRPVIVDLALPPT